MAHIENLRVYPLKGFDAVDVESIEITDAGTVEGDREYALVDSDGAGDGDAERVLNGKRIPNVHEVTVEFDREREVIELSTDAGERSRFDLATEPGAASEWFGEFVGRPVELRRRGPPSFVDRPGLGPSVVSTATLEAVASWFDDVTLEGARRRFRANVEVGGVPAFWEDRFLGDGSGFVAGGVRFEGVKPCGRCVVPSRDPDTGDPIDGFRGRFAERREATLPEWVDPDAFEHFYSVMILTNVPAASRGETLRVGDDVSPDGRGE